jgi:hypothetical protein
MANVSPNMQSLSLNIFWLGMTTLYTLYNILYLIRKKVIYTMFYYYYLFIGLKPIWNLNFLFIISKSKNYEVFILKIYSPLFI